MASGMLVGAAAGVIVGLLTSPDHPGVLERLAVVALCAGFGVVLALRFWDP